MIRNILAAVVIMVSSAATAEPYIMQNDWVTFKGKEYSEGYKLYRRYAFTSDEKQQLANLIVFHCALSNGPTYVSLQLPRLFQVRSFSRDKSFPTLNSRFTIPGQQSLSLTGEYKDGEFYFDLTDDTFETIGEIMEAERVSLGFGEKNDVFEFGFTGAVAKSFKAFAKEEQLDRKLGAISHYTSQEMLDDCSVERSRKRQK